MNQSTTSRRLRRCLFGVIVAAALCTAAASAALGQSAVSVSIWDGVYTEAQAKQGETAYFEYCVDCHGQDLEGLERAPALAGLGFMDKWNRAALRKLFEAVEQMPPDEPKTLTPQQYADVVAYLLSVNGVPAGSAALTADRSALGRIEIRNVRPTK
jgi:mono/diheme cytochrome c family protein